MEAVSYFTRSSITTAPVLPLIHHERIALPVVRCRLILKGKEKHPVCRDTTHLQTLHFCFCHDTVHPLSSREGVGVGGCLQNNHAGVDGVDVFFVLTQQIPFWNARARAISLVVFLPFYLLMRLSLLICHGKRCGGGRAASTPRHADAVAICSATSSDPTTQARRTLIY